ncbi:MAG: hypothetical protein J2P57_25705 [Acidimicrobiaceae bacterium]|nr:hypothetical protein [Acidimicrobiaceae bacterium]
MISDDSAVAAAYLEHLSDSDVILLAGRDAKGASAAEVRAALRGRRGGVEDLFVDPELFRAVFGAPADSDPMVGVSPFLLFAVAVQQTVQGLASATYVPEWAGVGRRTPVFDVARLRAFVSSPWSRLFLAELLASYTHVASGSVVVATHRGLRRRRFSELDPVRLAGLLEVVSDAERPGVLRRLGDLALFLTGVFPDHVGRRGFGPIEQERLRRASGRNRDSASSHDDSAVELLEQLGRRWYHAAFQLLPRPVPSSALVLGELSEHFGDARRILGVVTERFVFPYRNRWFDLAG